MKVKATIVAGDGTYRYSIYLHKPYRAFITTYFGYPSAEMAIADGKKIAKELGLELEWVWITSSAMKDSQVTTGV